MIPRLASKLAVATGQTAKTTRRRSSTGAGMTGAGCGAFILYILKGYQERPWAKALLYLAPSLSFVISAAVLWLRAQVDEYVAKRILHDVLEDPNANEQIKEDARKALQELSKRKIAVALQIIRGSK